MTKIIDVKEVPGSRLDEALATKIFNLINAFANYGFNRSHAAAYGVIGYRTAYLKAHYPHEFLAASMNLDMNSTEKLAEFAKEMRRTGIAFRGPDVNKSDVRFSVEKDPKCRLGKAVRWALSGIKGVGEQAMAELVAERKAKGPFASFHDFVRRTAGGHLNKRAYEGLIRAGALDGLHPNRAAMLAALDGVLQMAQSDAKTRNAGQVSLFDFVAPPPEMDRLPDVPEMPKLERLQAEFDVLGMFLTGHPIEAAERRLSRRRGRATVRQAFDPSFKPMGRESVIGALVMSMRTRLTRKNELMAILQISDATAVGEAVIFASDFERYRNTLKPGGAYVLTCNIEQRKDENGQRTEERQIIVRGVEPLNLDEELDGKAA